MQNDRPTRYAAALFLLPQRKTKLRVLLTLLMARVIPNFMFPESGVGSGFSFMIFIVSIFRKTEHQLEKSSCMLD